MPAPVAQRIEHLTTDQKVGGSNPFGRALLVETTPQVRAPDAFIPPGPLCIRRSDLPTSAQPDQPLLPPSRRATLIIHLMLPRFPDRTPTRAKLPVFHRPSRVTRRTDEGLHRRDGIQDRFRVGSYRAWRGPVRLGRGSGCSPEAAHRARALGCPWHGFAAVARGQAPAIEAPIQGARSQTRPPAQGDPSASRDDGIIDNIAEQHANELHHPTGRYRPGKSAQAPGLTVLAVRLDDGSRPGFGELSRAGTIESPSSQFVVVGGMRDH